MFRLPLYGVGVVCILVLGCGGGGSSNGSGGASGGVAGSGASPSGVSVSTKVSQATAAELTALCNAHKSELTGLATSACVIDGLGEATQAACETKRSACVSNPSTVPNLDCANPQGADLKSCDVTVGEFESCLSQLMSYFKTLSCADFGKTNLPNPPSCYSTLTSKCQFSTTGGAGSAG